MTKTKNNCPKCHKEMAISHPTFGLLQGKKCLQKDREMVGRFTPPPQFASMSMHSRITEDQQKHSKDILQPWGNNWQPNEDFVKAYPEQAKEYFSQEQLEKL